MSDPVVGTSDVFTLLIDKSDDVIGRTSVFFSNTGDVLLEWRLALVANAEDAPWLASVYHGELGARETAEIILSLNTSLLQSRSMPYVTTFILNSSSPTPTPVPLAQSFGVELSAVVSANADPVSSSVEILNTTQLAARDVMQFIVVPIDNSGMVMMDTSNVAFDASLTHPASNATVLCRIFYVTKADHQHHLGECTLPGLAAGGFTLDVRLGADVVGDGKQPFQVENCPMSFVLDHNGHSCTCPAGRYQLGSTCVACANGNAKPAPGVDKADCNPCSEPAATSNAENTACDACIDGYYINGNACVQCPNHPMPCVESSVLMPGYWRATVADDDDDTEILECRFGVVSCPGTNITQSGDESIICTRSKWHHCACGYAGPTCAVCDSTDAGGRFYMAWTSGKCESCDGGTSHGPTIGLACGLCAAGLAVAALAFTKRRRITSSRAYQLIHRIYRIGKVKFSIILFAFQARLQS